MAKGERCFFSIVSSLSRFEMNLNVGIILMMGGYLSEPITKKSTATGHNDYLSFVAADMQGNTLTVTQAGESPCKMPSAITSRCPTITRSSGFSTDTEVTQHLPRLRSLQVHGQALREGAHQ